MLRSVLAVLDSGPGSRAAESAALEIAKRFNARLDAVSTLELFWAIHRWQRPLIGLEVVLSPGRWDALCADLGQHVDRLVNDAAAAGLDSARVTVPERPDPTLAILAHAYDVVVLPQTAKFHADVGLHARDPVTRICGHIVRPALVVPEAAPAGQGTVVAYDGSAAASRSAHMAALLGLGLDAPVKVVCVRPSADEAQSLAETGAQLMRRHGAAAEAVGLETQGSDGERLLQFVREQAPASIVLGRIGHSQWREALLGSTAQTLCTASHTPLLIGS